VDALAGRMSPDNGLMTITDAYTGLRWGELAWLQWIRTYLDDDVPYIDVDPKFGALHEVRGRLEFGPPKTPVSVRRVRLPPFLADELRAHRERNPDARFVFTGVTGGLHRRSSFRRRFWLPALAGDEQQGAPLNQELYFHDLRHAHETWLIEDRVPRIMRLVRLGHKRKDVDDIDSHVTDQMIEDTLTVLRQQWAQDGGRTWQENLAVGGKRRDLFGWGSVVSRRCSQSAPQTH
jgi:integrase